MIEKCYETDRLLLIRSDIELAEAVTDYRIRNRDFLREYEPAKSEEEYTVAFQRANLAKDVKNAQDLSALRFWIAKKEQSQKIIGMVALNHIIRGAFESCFLGYILDAEEINQGYMSEAVSKCIEIAFNQIRLHRIEANIMPRNKSSLRVAEKLAFINEGLARDYMLINGKWEDHFHMVKFNHYD